MVRAEADGVAEIVDGEARHGGVQIDDADALVGVPVDQDVVQLRVVVGYPQGKFPFPQRPQSNAAVLFPRQKELNFRGYPFRPVQLIGFQRGEKLTEADFSVVEMGNGLVKCLGGIIPEHVLEPPERPSRRRKQLRRGRLIAVGIFDEGHQPPHPAPVVGHKIRAVSGFHQAQRLPGGVAALGKNLSAQIGRNAHKILHHFLRMGKRGLGQPLQYQLDSAALWGTARYAEGIVDVPLAVAGNVQNRTRQLVGRQNL